MAALRILVIAAAVAGGFGASHQSSRRSLTFDASGPNIVLTNADYQLVLRKDNGGIISLADERAGASIGSTAGLLLTNGSHGNCLWWVDAGPGIGGCSYGSPGSGNIFSYNWDGDTDTLSLYYQGNRSQSDSDFVDATVTITASDDSYFDMQIALFNRMNATAVQVILPAELLVDPNSVAYGYLPYFLPGIRLSQSYFTSYLSSLTQNPLEPNYPSGQAFADFEALDYGNCPGSGCGHLAMYMVQPPSAPVQPVDFAFLRGANVSCAQPYFCIHHSYWTSIPNGATWTSPVVRIRVGDPIGQSAVEYRQDNGIDHYPSVAAKLGSRFTAFSQALIERTDAMWVGKPLSQWGPELKLLPKPGLLHLVSYWGCDSRHCNPPDTLGQSGSGCAFDRCYPDFVNANDTGALQSFVNSAHALGLMVLPYTNPTWWNPDSSTVQGLDAEGIPRTSWSALNEDGTPILQCTQALAEGGCNGQTGGCAQGTETTTCNPGNVASPASPLVQRTLAKLMAQFRYQVPVDCVFEDQIGSAGRSRDYNPYGQNYASWPAAYENGWLLHTQTYSDQCLMTEDGWDRLAETEVGFDGGLLHQHNPDPDQESPGDPDQVFGTGNWTPYPIALWMFHDKVLMYQHDLAVQTSLHADQPGACNPSSSDLSNDEILRWDMTFGDLLTYCWATDADLTSQNLGVAALFQRVLGPRLAGATFGENGYSQSGTLTTSVFDSVDASGNPLELPGGSPDDLRVVANWSNTAPATYPGFGGVTMPPYGFVAGSDDGAIIAGTMINNFDGGSLSSGEHYLVILGGSGRVTVWQPKGPDGPVAVKSPTDGSRFQACPFTSSNHALYPCQKNLGAVAGKVTFRWTRQLRSGTAAYYVVS